MVRQAGVLDSLEEAASAERACPGAQGGMQQGLGLAAASNWPWLVLPWLPSAVTRKEALCQECLSRAYRGRAGPRGLPAAAVGVQ